MVVSNMVADETIYRLLEDPQGGLEKPEYSIVPPEVMKCMEIARTSGELAGSASVAPRDHAAFFDGHDQSTP